MQMSLGVDFSLEREKTVKQLLQKRILKSAEIVEAMLRVRRELFMPAQLIHQTYADRPQLIPGDERQTIPALSSMALILENTKPKKGEKVLDVGTGSGYGAALLRELIGSEGKVVTIEINSDTYTFGKGNLEKAGYSDIITVFGDGSKGYEVEAPFDIMTVTASCPEIPPPLIRQLKACGRLITPVGPAENGSLILLLKDGKGVSRQKEIAKVVYPPIFDGRSAYNPLLGKHGWKDTG